mgnify:CR=1 FL=1
MKIMSINAGSSSLKFSLFNMTDESVITSGVFERIGMDGSCYTIKFDGEKVQQEVELNNHTDAVKVLLEKLIDLGIIKSLNEIDGVGHRLVHGGEKFTHPVVITDEVIEGIKDAEQYIYSYILNGSTGIIIQWIRSDYSIDENTICNLLFLLNKNALSNLGEFLIK